MDHVAFNFVTTTQTALFETALAYAQKAGLDPAVASTFIDPFIKWVSDYLTYAHPMLASHDFGATEATIDT